MKRLIAAGVFVASLLHGVGVSAQARTFALEDLGRIVRVADPQISPDGRSIAVVIGRANFDDDRWDSQLAVVDIATGSVRQATFDRRGVGFPRWSPGGDRSGVPCHGRDRSRGAPADLRDGNDRRGSTSSHDRRYRRAAVRLVARRLEHRVCGGGRTREAHRTRKVQRLLRNRKRRFPDGGRHRCRHICGSFRAPADRLVE